MNCTTLSSRTESEFKDRLQSRIDLGFNPTFAVIFNSPDHSIQKISDILNEYKIQFIGCSSAGEIVNDLVLDKSIVAMLFEVNDQFIFPVIGRVDDHDSTYATARCKAELIKNRFEKSSVLVLCGGLTNDGSEVVRGFKDVLGDDLTLFGGLAGDDVQLQKTYVYNNEIITENGIVAVGFDSSKISITGISTSGWSGVGNVMEITKSADNIVYEIDGIPALELYSRIVGLDISKNIVLEEGVKFPLQVFRDDNVTVLRAPIFSTDDGGLMFPGGIKVGEKVRFCVPPDFDVIDSTIDNFKRLGTKYSNPDALILFSCFARRIAFGPLIKKEVQGIQRVWNKPMIGFFTYGEIGNLEDLGAEFHNETCSLLLISEN